MFKTVVQVDITGITPSTDWSSSRLVRFHVRCGMPMAFRNLPSRTRPNLFSGD